MSGLEFFCSFESTEARPEIEAIRSQLAADLPPEVWRVDVCVRTLASGACVLSWNGWIPGPDAPSVDAWRPALTAANLQGWLVRFQRRTLRWSIKPIGDPNGDIELPSGSLRHPDASAQETARALLSRIAGTNLDRPEDFVEWWYRWVLDAGEEEENDEDVDGETTAVPATLVSEEVVTLVYDRKVLDQAVPAATLGHYALDKHRRADRREAAARLLLVGGLVVVSAFAFPAYVYTYVFLPPVESSSFVVAFGSLAFFLGLFGLVDWDWSGKPVALRTRVLIFQGGNLAAVVVGFVLGSILARS